MYGNRILVYCLVSYGVTWGIVLPAYFAYSRGVLTLDELNFIYNAGALGPLMGAVASAWIYYGKTGVARVFSVMRFSGIGKRAWLLTLSPLGLVIVGLAVYPLVAGHAYTFADTRRQFALTDATSYWSWILPFISYSLLEEFGWRGFLLPHLQEKFQAMKATMVLTIIWAGWHLPFFLWRFEFSVFITFGFFFSIFVGALILTAIFNLSRGSVIPVIVFHFLNNAASALDKQYLVAVLGAGFVFVATYVVKTYGRENLSDGMRMGNFYEALQQKHYA